MSASATSQSPFATDAAKHMVLGQLLTNDIHDPLLLQAMGNVARENFMQEGLQGAAYADENSPFPGGRFMLAPLTFARLALLAEITPACRILDIGCLSGYSTAVLARLGAHVTGIDSDAQAVAQGQAQMKRLGIRNAEITAVASMASGRPSGAPYDVIIIEGAVADIPEAISAQLALGGRLVTVRSKALRPGIAGGLGKAIQAKRLDNTLQQREHADAAAPLLPGFELPPAFVF